MSFDAALADVGGVLRAISQSDMDQTARQIACAGTIVLYGCGREGLMMRALCMRLYHLGLRVAMQGDMTTPPVGPGDLFLCSAGPGQLSTVTALMDVARQAGAGTLLITAEPDRAPPADHLLVIPAQTMAQDQAAPTTTLPMGSLYEGAMFLVFEMLVLDLQSRLGQSAQAMRARHTNLE